MCFLMSVCPAELENGVSKLLLNHTSVGNDKKIFILSSVKKA